MHPRIHRRACFSSLRLGGKWDQPPIYSSLDRALEMRDKASIISSTLTRDLGSNNTNLSGGVVGLLKAVAFPR